MFLLVFSDRTVLSEVWAAVGVMIMSKERGYREVLDNARGPRPRDLPPRKSGASPGTRAGLGSRYFELVAGTNG